MTHGIYDVLDAVRDGVRLQLELQPRVNASLIASKLPFVRTVTVHNESAVAVPAIEINGRLAVSGQEPISWRATASGPIPAGGSSRIDDAAAFDVFAPLLTSAVEAVPATLTMSAAVPGAASGPTITAAVEVSAANEFLNVASLHGALAAFVQPNAPAITTVLRGASDLLRKRTGSGSLEGYQSGPGRAHRIAGAVYEALRAQRITYANPPASFEGTGQKVRTTEQVLAERFGTCVDLSVLYAACIEAAGLFPVVFITATHAFPGFHTGEWIGEVTVLSEPNVISNLVEVGEVRALEMTAIGPGLGSMSFRNAVKAADRHFQFGFPDLRSMIDVTRARIDGVRPMPGFGSTARTAEQLAELDAERPFVARSSLRNLTEVTAEEVVRGTLDRRDASPARFRAWKRDLLDLSLRNPLLNMPRTSKVLDLLVPPDMLADVDDVVHAGKKVTLLGGMDAEPLLGIGAARQANDLDALAPTLRLMFRTRRSLFSTRDNARHRRQLRSMKREATTLEQETGSNYLYLTLGVLVHDKPGGGEARSPLFMLPVRLTGGTVISPFGLELDGDEIAQPNLCLLEWLRITKGLELPELENPPVDDSGIAVGAAFDAIRARLLDARLPYRIDETASLAILTFASFQIWKDLDANWRQLMTNPVVRHLVERPGETFDDPLVGAEPGVDEAELRLPIAADGSQMAAVERAVRGQSFVLEGPPGTGKSQTITNLVSRAILTGKTVLFVAEKQAALDVVQRRLAEIGLAPFALDLHGAKQSMRHVRDQLRRALEVTYSPDQGRWEAVDVRHRQAVAALQRHPDVVHATNAAGHSLWSAFEAAEALGAGRTAPVAPSWCARPCAADVHQLTRDFAAVAGQVRLRPHHPWTIVGPTADHDSVEMLGAGLAELRAVRRRVAELPDAWRDALPALRPGAGLADIVLLLDGRSDGLLPTAGHVAYIDRLSWAEAVTGLRSDLAGYRGVHEETLTRFRVEAFGAPDLEALIARSESLDGAWFFPALRRRALVDRVRSMLRVEEGPAAAEVTRLLRGLRAALHDATPLVARASALSGLRLPPDWGPQLDGAQTSLDRAVAVSGAAVRVERTSPAASALLVDVDAATEAALRDLASGWDRWLGVVGGSGRTVEQWSRRRDWVVAWDQDDTTWSDDIATTGTLQVQRMAQVRIVLQSLEDAGLEAVADRLGAGEILPEEAPEALLRGVARAALAERGALGSDTFDADSHERAAATYLETAEVLRELSHQVGPATVVARRPFRLDNLRGEVAELRRQIERKRGGLTFRQITARYPQALTSVVPVLLMSPGSVARYLDPSLVFDIVVFDEASQIRVSQAVGALGRGRSVVVVGDSRQMPPTRIMQIDTTSAQTAESELHDEVVVEDLESILSEAVESGLPQSWLGWHYRSRDERLVAFSNERYYDGRLVTLPAAGSDPRAGVHWRRIDGRFDRGGSRTNEAEARAVVDEILSRLRDPATADDTIGVVCFNVQQRDLILDMLEDSPDLLVQQALAAEPGRNLVVKNLENVQGDERDTILFSLAFSVDPQTGILPLNFGPLNLPGGERRLNVAITRARREVVIFSSFDPAHVDLRRSGAQGVADLRRYLEFAAEPRTAPRGDRGTAPHNGGRLVEELAAALTDRGFEVEPDVGLSAFRVDLAARRPGDAGWRLAVMVDGPAWSSRPTVADRDGAPALLTQIMGWPCVVRVWLPGWLRDRAGTVDRLVHLLETDGPVDVPAPSGDVHEDASPSAEAGDPPDSGEPALDERQPDLDHRGGTPRARPFRGADQQQVGPQSALASISAAAPRVIDEARHALAAEGPMAMRRLVLAIARRFGYSRLGERRRGELAAVIESHLRVVDGFVWPPDLDPETWRGVQESSPADRTILEISPHEVRNGLELALREAFSMEREELLRETARTFGYRRATPEARSWIEAALEVGLAVGRFSVTDGRLRVVGA